MWYANASQLKNILEPKKYHFQSLPQDSIIERNNIHTVSLPALMYIHRVFHRRSRVEKKFV